MYIREVGSVLLVKEGENHEIQREAQPVCRMLGELHELLKAAMQCGSVILTCPEEMIGKVLT